MILSDEVERKSLCRVSYDYDGKRWLTRLGDIENGIILRFNFDDTQPQIFDNRTRLFWKDGPEEEGAVGIWDWSAVPNKSSDTDYVRTTYSLTEHPIEVFEVPSVTTNNELIIKLKEGIAFKPCCENVVFCYRRSNIFISGVLCQKSSLQSEGQKTYISEKTVSLPLCDFTASDIIRFSDRTFIRNLNKLISAQKIVVKSSNKIVREAILKRCSWNAMKNRGMTRNEWKKYRDFLEDISDDTLYSDIASICECSMEEAKTYVDEFIKLSEQYITTDDIDSQVLLGIIDRNEELKKTCEKIAALKWEEEHRDILDAKNEEIKKAEVLLKTLQGEVDEKNIELEKRKTELEDVERNIKERAKLGDDIEKKVLEKIEEAKANMSEFISNQVFYGVGQKSSDNNAVISKETVAFHMGDKLYDGENSDWKDVIDSVEDELVEAGVALEYRRSLSAYLYSAFINRFSIILAGPNAEEIGNAFSIGAFGQHAGVFDCMIDYNSNEINKMLSSDNEVIIIKSSFNSNWIDKIMELCLQHQKFYFLTVPFVEDVFIEPKGLFNYALPMITDLYVDEVSRKAYVGRKRSESYKEYVGVKPTNVQENVLHTLHVPRFAKKRIQGVLTDMHNIEKNTGIKDDYTFLLVPYAYFTDQVDVISEQIESEEKLAKDVKGMLKGYLGTD